jgi:hypothetical protein
MSYELQRLASGSYDVLLQGVVIASLVRSRSKGNALWTVELLEEMRPSARPAPFRKQEHKFASLGEAREWLGITDFQDTFE